MEAQVVRVVGVEGDGVEMHPETQVRSEGHDAVQSVQGGGLHHHVQMHVVRAHAGDPRLVGEYLQIAQDHGEPGTAAQHGERLLVGRIQRHREQGLLPHQPAPETLLGDREVGHKPNPAAVVEGLVHVFREGAQDRALSPAAQVDDLRCREELCGDPVEQRRFHVFGAVEGAGRPAHGTREVAVLREFDEQHAGQTAQFDRAAFELGDVDTTVGCSKRGR